MEFRVTTIFAVSPPAQHIGHGHHTIVGATRCSLLSALGVDAFLSDWLFVGSTEA